MTVRNRIASRIRPPEWGGRRRLDVVAGVLENYAGVSEANVLISAASFVQAGKLVRSCLTVIRGLWSLIIINR